MFNAIVIQLPTIDYLKDRFRLSERQAQITLLLALRRTNKEIAAELGFTIYTAERHTEKILEKLGVNSRRLVVNAIQAGVTN
jgi:DNA-binding CsgD family transcriptional regulator